MRENVREESIYAGTDNASNTSNTQQNESAELHSSNQEGMIYLDIIQRFAL
jgi:hypothetical protein